MANETNNYYDRTSYIKLVFQGLFNICDFLPYDDVLTCRLVCKDWEYVITHLYRRFTQATVTFDEETLSYMEKNVEIITKRQVLWRNVHLTFSPLHQESSQVFSCWETIGRLVRKLYLQKLGLNCIDLLTFLNECPSVKEITFDDVRFWSQQNDLRKEVVYKKVTICSCVPEKSKILRNSMDSISSITFKCQNVIPLCLIAYLNSRSKGKLQKFIYTDATCWAEDRKDIKPCKKEVEKYLADLISNNSSSLKIFAVFNSRDMEHFLNTISSIQLQRCEEMHLDCGLLKSYSLNKTFRFELLRQNSHLKVLKLGLHNPDVTTLADVMRKYGEAKQLRKLKISLNKGQIDSFLQPLTQLRELEIEENFYTKRIKKFENWGRVNPNYLKHLPSSLVSLTIKHSLENFVAWDFHTLKNLKQLIIKCFDVNDEMFQILVMSCPQLEVLNICNSMKLSDTGITGISSKEIQSLKKSLKTSLSNATDSPECDITKKSHCLLNNLKNLKMLSLAGCKRLSNIAIEYGIQSKNLRILNLSDCIQIADDGFKCALQNCPHLERLIMFRSNISLDAIIDIACTSKKLLKIHLTKTKKMLKYINDVNYIRDNYEILSSINHMFTTQPPPLGDETIDYTNSLT